MVEITAVHSTPPARASRRRLTGFRGQFAVKARVVHEDEVSCWPKHTTPRASAAATPASYLFKSPRGAGSGSTDPGSVCRRTQHLDAASRAEPSSSSVQKQAAAGGSASSRVQPKPRGCSDPWFSFSPCVPPRSARGWAPSWFAFLETLVCGHPVTQADRHTTGY